MKSFVQRVIALARRHPKGCAWGGLVFGVLALIGGIMNVVSPDPNQPHENPAGGFILAIAIIVGCAFLLLRWRRQEWAAQQAEIAARADAQHQAFLAGDDFGVFGTRETPPL